MKKITLTVPLIHSALMRSADMLKGMADDLVDGYAPDNKKIQKKVNDVDLGAPVTDEEPPAERDPAEVFGGDELKKPVESATGPEDSTETATSDPALAATTSNTTVIAGVELDDDKLPWDHRINSLAADGSHSKLKKTGTWKLKRGVDPVLVEQVQAELRAAMAVPGPATTEPLPDPDPTAQTEPPTPGVDWTFPTLMSAITAAGYEQHVILAAVQKQGLLAIPLLAARPDLVNAVAVELGLS